MMNRLISTFHACAILFAGCTLSLLPGAVFGAEPDLSLFTGETVAILPLTGTSDLPVDVVPHVKFDRPVAVGTTGEIRLHRARDGEVVDRLEVGEANRRQIGPQEMRFNPVLVQGTTAFFAFDPAALEYGETYYVTADRGILVDEAGKPSAAIADPASVRFEIRESGPDKDARRLSVSRDGKGDFFTVQGSIDHVPGGRNGHVTIDVADGSYEELVYLGSSKSGIRIRGESRDGVVIHYPNNANYNSSNRASFRNQANDLVLENLTLRNTTPKGGSQAEAFLSQADRVVARNCSFISFQDTLRLDRSAYFKDCYIEGDVDYIWGAGVAYFDHCHFHTVHQGYLVQARNRDSAHGFIFRDCILTGEPEAAGTYLARIDPSRYPHSEVVFIRCAMDDHIDPVGWRLDHSDEAPDVRFFEYKSTDLEGNPLDLSARLDAATEIDAATAASFDDPTAVLGWEPYALLSRAATSAPRPAGEAQPETPPAGNSGAKSVGDPPWNAELGDGRYRNPVLFADYSDPDVVRQGDDYWMTSSSFGHSPGLPILHSRDLVNWRLVNYALPRIPPEEHFSTPRHGNGVWAPSLRHHDGKFWIFYGDPDFGIYVLTAENPAGEWSKPHLLKPGKGLIDPSPLWDDDGEAYVVHAWARSRSGINNILTLHRMSPDGRRILDEGKVIIDGNALPGWRTLEGPKFYKRDGWYWIFAPAGGVAEGYQGAFRSRRIEGPYEERVVLEQGDTDINGPHQGAWVQAPPGEHWFFHFQEKLPYGRIVHLQPMEWRDDGWPVMGSDPDGDGTGEPVAIHTKPNLPEGPVLYPPTSDDFFSPELGLQWQWQANPSEEWASLSAVPGSLRLACVPRDDADSLWLSPHLLMQKFPAPGFEASTSLDFSSALDGDEAGLIVFGYDYRWIGLQQNAGELRLVLRTCVDAREGGTERESASVPVSSPRVDLRVTVQPGGLCQFAYRRGDEAFQPIGDPFQARESRWVGAKVGLFAAGSKNEGDATGYAEFEAFLVH